MKLLLIKQAIKRLTDNQDVNNLIHSIYIIYTINKMVSNFVINYKMSVSDITDLSITSCHYLNHHVGCFNDCQMNGYETGYIFRTGYEWCYPGLCQSCLNIL